MKDLHRALRKLQRRRPTATPNDLAMETYATFGVRLTPETFRRALTGVVDPTTCGAELLGALKAFYGATDDDLGHFAAERLRTARLVIGPDTPRDQESAPSGWFRPTADRHLSVAN